MNDELMRRIDGNYHKTGNREYSFLIKKQFYYFSEVCFMKRTGAFTSLW